VIVPRLRLAEMLRRLGVQQINREPMPLAEVVSPCLTVGDLREHIPPVLAPRAIFGGAPAITAGNFGCFQLRCRAAGGLVVNFFQIGFLPASLVSVTIRTAAVALTTTTALVPQDYGGTLVTSTAEAGDVAALAVAGANIPVLQGLAGNLTATIPQRVFLKPGEILYVESRVANAACSYYFDVQEFELPN
jgi:hypothetical protein